MQRENRVNVLLHFFLQTLLTQEAQVDEVAVGYNALPFIKVCVSQLKSIFLSAVINRV